jgi:hypothetical protein
MKTARERGELMSQLELNLRRYEGADRIPSEEIAFQLYDGRAPTRQ